MPSNQGVNSLLRSTARNLAGGGGPNSAPEEGATFVNVQSGKEYVVTQITATHVYIQSIADSEIKFKLNHEAFAEKYRRIDVNEALFQPDPERFTFDRMILYPDAVDSINIGINRILRHPDMIRIWGIDKIEPEAKSILNFYGPPGTGKTMAAKCVATKLGKKMVQADYASLVSKWHGDTGKHIKALFEMAKRHDAIVFLDEADSLVSQRIAMNESRLTVATTINTERNVFMQELDSFDGMVMLCTNFFGNYDEAMLRRCAQHIHFKLPNEEMRLQLFKLHMPNMARADDDISWVDIAKATDSFSGGDIKQAMLNAMNLASLEPDPETWMLTMEHVVSEVKKLADAKIAHQHV
jgi:SpoVK/Ycf46/Vps4 family AAA+-type ATPase